MPDEITPQLPQGKPQHDACVGAAAEPMSAPRGPRLRVVLLGTRGVPARYGGFETAMEEVGRRLVTQGHEVTVYCRTGNSGESPEPTEHLGMELIHLPALKRRSWETLSHTLLSALHLIAQRRRFDAAVVCNAANAPALPLLRLRGLPVAVHVDGLEWRRTKWGPVGRKYYRYAESLSVRWADALIADAKGIERYYEDEFGAQTVGIAYGAPDLSGVGSDLLHTLGIQKERYHLVVARFEPENNVDLMIEGYLRSQAEHPLLIVGSTPYPNRHSARIEELVARSDRVRLLGGVWDQDLLDQLYAGALTYLHGHSVGGTNPSLLRAMGAGTQTIAYDVIFNRDVAGPDAIYCRNAEDVATALNTSEGDTIRTKACGQALAERARDRYTWERVAGQYLTLCVRLAAGERTGGRVSGRRSKGSRWRAGQSRAVGKTSDSAQTVAESVDSQLRRVRPQQSTEGTCRISAGHPSPVRPRV